MWLNMVITWFSHYVKYALKPRTLCERWASELRNPGPGWHRENWRVYLVFPTDSDFNYFLYIITYSLVRAELPAHVLTVPLIMTATRVFVYAATCAQWICGQLRKMCCSVLKMNWMVVKKCRGHRTMIGGAGILRQTKPTGSNRKWIVHQAAFWLGGPKFMWVGLGQQS